MTNNSHASENSESTLESLVTELLTFGGMTAQIIDHMARFSAAGLSAPDAPPIDVVLNGLLSDVLRPVLANYGQSEVQTAVRLVKEITAQISEEIMLVSPDALSDQA
jgi:hypothetical protein